MSYFCIASQSDLCERRQSEVGAEGSGCLPAGVDECRFLLTSQRYVGCRFVNEARDLFTVVSAGGAVLRFLLKKHLATYHLIFPFAVITTGDTPPVQLVLSQQELTTPPAISCWERQHASEIAAVFKLLPPTRSRRGVFQSRSQLRIHGHRVKYVCLIHCAKKRHDYGKTCC